MFYTFLGVSVTVKTFAATFYSQFGLLGEKEPLHNILSKFGAFRLQLIDLNLLMRFSFDPKFLSFPWFV